MNVKPNNELIRRISVEQVTQSRGAAMTQRAAAVNANRSEFVPTSEGRASEMPDELSGPQ